LLDPGSERAGKAVSASEAPTRRRRGIKVSCQYFDIFYFSPLEWLTKAVFDEK
jgi:hypothetical protein